MPQAGQAYSESAGVGLALPGLPFSSGRMTLQSGYAVQPQNHEPSFLRLRRFRAAPQSGQRNAGLLSPTTPQFAFVFDDPVPVNQADFTAMANVAGLPAVAFPAGLTGGMDGGLPLSVQVMAWTEADALNLAQALARPVFTPSDFAG